MKFPYRSESTTTLQPANREKQAAKHGRENNRVWHQLSERSKHQCWTDVKIKRSGQDGNVL